MKENIGVVEEMKSSDSNFVVGLTQVRRILAESCDSNYQIWTNVCRKEDTGIADNKALLVLDHALAAHEARQNTLINSLRWPKVKDYDRNWHEGGDGCC